MTTISPSRRKGTFGSAAVIAALGIILCLAVAALLRPQAGNLFWKLAAPVLALRNSVSNTDASQLRAELASTSAALADRNAVYVENVQLKQLLGRTPGNHTTLGAILQRPPGIPYDTLVIDIGKNGGVTPGALVFAGGSSVIGTVSDVYDTTSRVVLFSAPGESYQASLVGGTPISLTGQGAGSMSGEVPSGTPVSAGEAVTLPGIVSAFAGSVSYINQESGASFITVYVQLPVNLFTLRYVEVQTP